MAKLSDLLYPIPRAYSIIFSRLVLLALCTAAFALFATTLHIYNSRIAPTDSLAPINDHLLIINAVPLIPLTLSILWSLTQLTLLASRVRHTYRQNSSGLGPGGAEDDARGGDRPLVHPGWDFGVDFICFALLVAMTVLTGMEVGQWKAGTLGVGPGGGTVQVDLKACPSFDQATGMLDYWCGDAWNQLVDLTSGGMNIMGPAAGMHFCRFFCACYGLYHLRRCRRAEELHRKLSVDENTAPPPYPARDIELERMEKGAPPPY